MDVLGKPWTGHVFEALDRGPLRFGALRDAVGSIGDRMLALRLRELEERGLVVRHVIEGPPVGVSYELTPAGRGFREVASAMRKWGAVVLRAAEAGSPSTQPSRRRR
ncbi:MAG: putative regulatory protein [Labilithrix sp.]|nr:putative regulatory protein [Labilithrix sp.]